jgi:addiction module RelE/StbE family toxin
VKIQWTRGARADLNEIFDYLLLENPGAAPEVLDKIEQSAAYLADHPGMGRPGRVKSTRELIIPGLPWILPYLTGPDTITIVRVIHAAMQWPGSFDGKS